jgi:hypothetical protein
VGAEGLGELGREPPDRAGGPENQGLLAGLDLADIADRLAVLDDCFHGVLLRRRGLGEELS